MPDPVIDVLRQRLLRGGVAPRHVIRAVTEFSDHFEDLQDEAAEYGIHGQAAVDYASRQIGSADRISNEYLNKPELKCWFFRHQRLARVVLPVAYVLVLPTVPLAAGVANAPAIARWCAGLLLSAFITAGMLLVMQISISSG